MQAKCATRAQMAIVIGRSGVGKTQLAIAATQGTPTLYFLASRKAEPMLCRDYVEEIRRVLGLDIDENITDFRSLLKLIIVESEKRRFNLIIDEAQEFSTVNSKIFEDIQSIWNRNVERSKLFMVLLGNELKTMTKAYVGKHAPLVNSYDELLRLSVYTPSELKQVLKSAHPSLTQEELLAVYAFTSGVPKYVDYLLLHNAYNVEDIVSLICTPYSPYWYEGKSLLIPNVGKEYTFYFSILSCIAYNVTSRSCIEETLNKEIGGYLTRMEGDFGLIEKQLPLFSKTISKNVRYVMPDNYLRYWFRYVYDKLHLLSCGKYEQMKSMILSDYERFSAIALNHYFTAKYSEDPSYTTIGAWWDHSDDNRVDVVALNPEQRKAELVLVDISDEANAQKEWEHRTEVLLENLDGYEVNYRKLGIQDM